MIRRFDSSFGVVARRNFAALTSALLFCLIAPAAMAASQPVLMISIDGLKPEYVTQADTHGLKIPTLRRFMTEGSYADGVIGVMPTVTYPSHTTLITGVAPAAHGIYNNGIFDPEREYSGAWYWYAQDIRVATLWDAARAKGLVTASVSWPVSVDAKGVEYLIPEYWRTASPAGATNPDDRKLMAAISRPVGMLAEMETRIGPYMMGNDTTVDGDATRTRFSLEILKTKKPGFMTIHLSSLDESEHISGPFSDEADKTLEAVDGMVAQLIAAARANDPRTVVVIVSDHGFASISKNVNLAIPFIQAGLIKIGKPAGLAGMMGGSNAVTEWQAEPWAAGGMAAVIFHDPSNEQVKAQVKAMLDKLAADPENGIARILTAAEIASKYHGFPNASFVIALKPGFATGSALSGALVTDTPGKGTHGYLTDFPEMHSSFFIEGAGIAHGKDLGTVDMRQIAPTVAGIMGASLPDAKEKPLAVSAK